MPPHDPRFPVDMVVAGSPFVEPDRDERGLDARTLAPLAWNSSRHARSHAPAADSPVIDAGNSAADRSYEQRGSGFPRVVGANADIGAIELDPERISTDGFD